MIQQALVQTANIVSVMRHLRFRRFCLWTCVLACVFLGSCGQAAPGLPRLVPSDVVLAFGDSLTHGTGVAQEQSYPAVLSAMIGRTVVTSGVPGERTAEGLERLPEVLDAHQPRIMLLCLGGNDLLRKVDAAEIEANLRAMIEMARARNVGVVLIGVPRPALVGGTAQLYKTIAEDHAIPYEGAILNEILRNDEYKSDPVHPNARGYRMLAVAIADVLRRNGAI
jgi:lysophospholipase L1-like esterase